MISINSHTLILESSSNFSYHEDAKNKTRAQIKEDAKKYERQNKPKFIPSQAIKEQPPTVSKEVLQGLYEASDLYSKEFPSITRKDAYEKIIFPVAWTESTFNPKAKSKNDKYHGLFQFDLVSANEVGLKNRLDPRQSSIALVKYMKKNVRGLQWNLNEMQNNWKSHICARWISHPYWVDNIDEKDWEIFPTKPHMVYLLHQQGATGCLRIYAMARFAKHVTVSMFKKTHPNVARAIKDNVDEPELKTFSAGQRTSIDDMNCYEFLKYWEWKMNNRHATGTKYSFENVEKILS